MSAMRLSVRSITGLALMVVAATTVSAASYTTQIPLIADGGGAAGQTWPMGAGIPGKPGQFPAISNLGIADAAGNLIPAAFEVRAKWPDGSAKWVWADFQAAVGTRYTMLNTGQKAALPASGVTVTDSTASLVVDNGAMRVTWQKTLGSPTAIAVNGAQVAAGDGRGIYVIDQNGAVAALSGTLAWRVETNNRLRAVIRVEGNLTTTAGAALARSIVRYHLYRGQPWMKIEHSLVITRDNEQTTFREVGVRMPLAAAGAPTVRFGRTGNAPYAVGLGATDQAYAFQSAVPRYDNTTSSFLIGRSGTTLTTGTEADGWADLSNGSRGVYVKVRDFAQQFPIELHATPSAVTAKLWSSRGGVRLDYKPSTLIDNVWGQTWSSYAPTAPSSAWTYSQLRNYNPSPVGVAKTHELMVGYYAGAYDQTRAVNWSRTVQAPPVVMPDPRWTVHVDHRVFPMMAAKAETGTSYAALERFTSHFFDEMMVAQRVFPYTGWYDWGKLADLRYERASNGRVYAQFTRLNYTNPYYIIKGLTIAWVRTGERRYLDAARRYNQMIADNQVVHHAGGKDNKVKGRLTLNGASNHPVHWSGSGILHGHSSREPIWGFVMEYYLQDSRWIKDNLDMIMATLVPYVRTFQGSLTAASPLADRQTAVYNAFRCEPFPGLNVLNSAAMYSSDPAILSFARMMVATLTDTADPGGIDTAFFTRYNCTGGALYKPDRTAVALINYFDHTGDARARQIIPLIARRAASAQVQPVAYQNMSGVYLARAYQLTGAADLRTMLQSQVTKVQQQVGAFEALTADRRGVNHFRATMGTTGHTNLNHWRYPFTGLPAFNGTTAMLEFSTPCNNTAFFALPTAAWGLQGFPN